MTIFELLITDFLSICGATFLIFMMFADSEFKKNYLFLPLSKKILPAVCILIIIFLFNGMLYFSNGIKINTASLLAFNTIISLFYLLLMLIFIMLTLNSDKRKMFKKGTKLTLIEGDKQREIILLKDMKLGAKQNFSQYYTMDGKIKYKVLKIDNNTDKVFISYV
jgi:hypothetical protein